MAEDPNVGGGDGGAGDKTGGGTALTSGAGGDGGSGGSAGGGDFDWRGQIPEQFSKEPVLSNVKDIPDLVTQFVNSQKLIGTEKIAKPNANWTEEQWNDFWGQVGRPESPEAYKIPTGEALDGIEFNEDTVKTALGKFHELGLQQKQVDGVMGFYLDMIKGQASAESTASEQRLAEATQQLKTEFGDQYDVKLDIAKGVLGKFGDQALIDELDSTGLGNNPHVIRLLAKIGSQMSEDDATGMGAGLFSTDAMSAKAEIDTLKSDPEFLKALNDRTNPAHKGAVERWSNLHEKAFPGEVTPT